MATDVMSSYAAYLPVFLIPNAWPGLRMSFILIVVLHLAACGLGIALYTKFLSVSLSPFALSISPIRLSDKARHLAVGKIRVFLHIPSRERPQWASIALHNVEYRSIASQHFTISKILLTFPFFPTILGKQSSNNSGEISQPAPAHISVDLYDFCVRVASSQRTPFWLASLRTNLLDTILNEETLRLDVFRLKTVFSTVKARSQFYSADEDDDAWRSPEAIKLRRAFEEQNETRITHRSSEWHIQNHITERRYVFGDIIAQLRRNWLDDTGVFTLIAEDCHWTRCPPEEHETKDTITSIPRNLVIRMWTLLRYTPAAMYTLYVAPKSLLPYLLCLVDIHLHRTDVTFDRFHVCDADPLKHGAETLRRTLEKSQVWPGVAKDWFVDAVLTGLGMKAVKRDVKDCIK